MRTRKGKYDWLMASPEKQSGNFYNVLTFTLAVFISESIYGIVHNI